MYYYLDTSNTVQGPYSRNAYEKWYESDVIPAGTRLFDQNLREFTIEEVVAQSLKSRTKVMFEDESLLERTNLDVTINLNQTYGGPNDSTFIRSDFTQIDEECDDVDSGRITGDGSMEEIHSSSCELQKVVNHYIGRRALLNRRRRFPDTYVPFEFSWPSWVPQPLDKHQAMRGAAHWHNRIQEQDPDSLSKYLRHLNIQNRPCHRCRVEFSSTFEMFMHFVSVPHVNKMYGGNDDNGNAVFFSMIDVYTVEKMINEVELMEMRALHSLEPFNTRQEASFFDDAETDVATAFESLHSTCVLMQGVPLLSPPRDWSDACEYIESLVLFRHLEKEYVRIDASVRRRRLDLKEPIRCAFCGGGELGGHTLDHLASHFLSDHHVLQSAYTGTSRTAIEYWLSFFGALVKQKNRADGRWRKNETVSLQENDFPLCYRLVDLAPGDFVYQGTDVDQVLRFVREHVRLHFSLLDDGHYRTSCRWCRVELNTRLGVLRHVLHDKKHTEKLRMVSNDDLRRLLKSLDVPITMPLFRQSQNPEARLMRAHDKRVEMQRLKNVAWRKHKQRAVQTLAMHTFPMGLVNRCDLCQVDVEHVDGILTHFISEKHSNNVLTNPRIAESDVACWREIFKTRKLKV